jgi:hypothetical protein
MRIVIRLLKFVVAILLLPLLLGFSQQAVNVLVESASSVANLWFFGGLVTYVLLYLLGLRHRVVFLSHYVHESAHAIAAFLTFHPVRRLLVNPFPAPGEEISHITIPSGFLDAVSYLAPYCLPLLALPFMIVRLLVPPSMEPAANLLIGVTMGFFYTNLLREFGGSATDFPGAGGFVFSAIIIALANSILLVVVLSIVSADYAGILEYVRASWSRSLVHYEAAIQMWGTFKRFAVDLYERRVRIDSLYELAGSPGYSSKVWGRCDDLRE